MLKRVQSKWNVSWKVREGTTIPQLDTCRHNSPPCSLRLVDFGVDMGNSTLSMSVAGGHLDRSPLKLTISYLRDVG